MIILGGYVFEIHIPYAFNVIGASIALVEVLNLFYMPGHSSDENCIFVKSTIILILYTISLYFVAAIAEIATDTLYR